MQRDREKREREKNWICVRMNICEFMDIYYLPEDNFLDTAVDVIVKNATRGLYVNNISLNEYNTENVHARIKYSPLFFLFLFLFLWVTSTDIEAILYIYYLCTKIYFY